MRTPEETTISDFPRYFIAIFLSNRARMPTVPGKYELHLFLNVSSKSPL